MFPDNMKREEYRNSIALPLALLCDEARYAAEKESETKLYRQLSDLLFHMEQNVAKYPAIKAFLWTLESRGISGTSYGAAMNKDIEEVIRIVGHACGKDMSVFDEAFLRKSIENRGKALGINSLDAYCMRLEESAAEADTLFRSLGITHSEFFRNPLAFALLEQWILPNLASRKSVKGEIRIWSACCAAGQEAYSIAMLLDGLKSVSGNEIRFRIFATDISLTALAQAREGTYDQKEVQSVKLMFLQRYFERKGGTYIVTPRLRDQVNFSVYDLLDRFSAYPAESIYGDFDIVFCSNILFYYSAEIQNLILMKMRQSMSDDGCLITGEAEKALVERTGAFRMFAPPAAVFQRKKV
jgi:chemotaxis methyl-accepting protein methylase